MNSVNSFKNNKRIILASASPRRRELLSLITDRFEVITADVDERAAERKMEEDGVPALKVSEHLAEIKARAVYDSLSDEEKDYKSKRKMIQQKLIKFATRIPIFMYLTDFREMSLRDVITDLEPDLFRKVTGLTVNDFNLLVSLNLFNSSLMDDAVFKFKRYEDASLTYTGIDMHCGEDVGLYSTVITREDYDAMAKQQTLSMQAEQRNVTWILGKT